MPKEKKTQSIIRKEGSLAPFDPKASKALITRGLKDISKIGTKRILLVDDEKNCRIPWIYVLKMIGDFNIFEVDNGFEGIKAIHKENGNFDLIITGIVMPRLNGIVMIKAIKIEWPDIPIIVITGGGQDAYKKELQELISKKLIHYNFPKPFDFEELKSCVSKVLNLNAVNVLKT